MGKWRKLNRKILGTAGIFLFLIFIFYHGKISEAAYSFFTVEKEPVAAAIVYGQPLSVSGLSGGTVKNGYTNTVNACDFRWSSPNVFPSAGTHVYEAYPVVNETVKCNVTVTVQPKNIGQCQIDFEDGQSDAFEYTGSPVEPEIAVFDGDSELEAGTDYAISYVNNLNAGDAGAVITGRGNYGGSVTRYFVIAGADLETEVSSEDFSGEYDGKPHTGAVSAPSDSVISYGTTQGTYHMTSIPSYTDAGNYTVYYCVQKTNYQPVYGSFQIEISGKSNLEEECRIEDTEAVFDGKPHSIGVTIPKGATIRYGTRKAGSYESSVNPAFTAAGSHTVYFCVSLKNFQDYEGEATVSIGETDIEKCSISLKNQRYIYTGNPIEPEVILINANKTALVRDVDYELEFYNNVDAGTAQVTATGKGNYAGYVSLDFEIMQKSVENVEVPIIPQVYTYGTALSEIALPDNYEWGNDTELPHAGTDKYQAVYTPEDTNYGSVIVEVFITVYKAEPDVSEPQLDAVVYDEKLTLKDIVFPEDDEGTWKWEEPDAVPVVNNKGYAAFFTPKDTVNYNARRMLVPLDVEKGIPHVSVPDGINGIYSPEKTLKEYPLPAGFSWDMPDEVPAAGNEGYPATYTPLDENYETVSDFVIPVNIQKAVPEPPVPEVLERDIVYSPEQTLEDIGLTEGWRWLEADTVPAVKNSGYPVVFVPEDEENYESVYEIMKLSVRKADPEEEVPDVDETFTYSMFHTLQSVALPDGWRWQSPETVPEVNNSGYKAVFVPKDEENYNCLEETIVIDVEPGVAVCTKPVFENIPYTENMTLGDIALPQEEYGKWAWEDSGQKILSKEDDYPVSFLPDDSKNLLPFETEIRVSVLAYDSTMAVPENLTVVYSPERVLGDILLPDGWKWEEEDTVPTTGEHSYGAVFTPDNTDLYQTVYKNLTITVNPGRLFCREEPAAGSLPYGSTLADVQILEGEMETEENETAAGVWKWENENLAADSLVPVLAYLLFVPEDANYETSRFQVSVPIVKGSRKVTGIVAHPCSYRGSKDGMIEGVTKEMEYKLHSDTEDKYKSCTGKQITGLEPGVYDVRYRNTEFYYASQPVSVVIKEGKERYRVQYISEGSLFTSYEILSGEALIIPSEIPFSQYKHFKGWYSGTTRAEVAMKVVSNLTFQAEFMAYTSDEMEKAQAEEFVTEYQEWVNQSVTDENRDKMKQMADDFMNLSDTAISYLPADFIFQVKRIRTELDKMENPPGEMPAPAPGKPSDTQVADSSPGNHITAEDGKQQGMSGIAKRKEGVAGNRPKRPTVSKKKIKKTSVTVRATRRKGCRYVFQCSKNRKFVTKKQISVSSPSATFKKLKSGKRYYFRVRAYFFLNGKVVYSKWSTIKSVKLKN